ncbi:hypothetical protein TL16_g11022, partial [Triparma laevis f. inornata]
MLESYFGRLLSTFLGRFFTLPTESKGTSSGTSSGSSLTMSVWSGFVELKDLLAKLNVINNLIHTSFENSEIFNLMHFTIGRFELTVPWSSLGSKPITVVIDSIHLITEVNLSLDSSTSEQSAINKIKKRLNKLERISNPQMEKKFSLLTYLSETVINKIIDTIQIHIRSLHIRLEDSESSPSNGFAFGMTMESLHINSETGREDVINKIIQLNHASIYLNSIDNKIKGTIPEVNKKLNDQIPRRNNISPQNHTYILKPINVSSRINLLKDFEESFRNMSFKDILLKVECDLSSINLNITSSQVQMMLGLLNSQKVYTKLKTYNIHRPTSPTFVPKEWWIYGYRCVIGEVRRRRSGNRWNWKDLVERGRWRKVYCGIYEK